MMTLREKIEAALQAAKMTDYSIDRSPAAPRGWYVKVPCVPRSRGVAAVFICTKRKIASKIATLTQIQTDA
jgi:hypothetical protein